MYLYPLGVTSSGIVLPAAVTIQFTCTSDFIFPIWILQGQVIDDIPPNQKEELGVNLLRADIINGSKISSSVRINGSLAIHNMILECSIRRVIVYSHILLYQGWFCIHLHCTLMLTNINQFIPHTMKVMFNCTCFA